jgi:hypothetical protein
MAIHQMNERIQILAGQAEDYADGIVDQGGEFHESYTQKLAELIMQDMHKKVIASILITDVVMEEKGQVPTSEDYIRAINKDFGVEE